MKSVLQLLSWVPDGCDLFVFKTLEGVSGSTRAAIECLSQQNELRLLSCRLAGALPQQRTQAKVARTNCAAKTKETTEINFVPFQEVQLPQRLF